jgi:hypothetical protein
VDQACLRTTLARGLLKIKSVKYRHFPELKHFPHRLEASMKELFYFSFADLMARVEYHQEANTLRYATHRKIAYSERVIVEQYLLTNFAQKTEYYKRQPALFVYLGTDAQLTKDLDAFHLKNTLRELVEKEKDVKDSVSGLINQSMQNYYFERIGDTILDARREIADVETGLADERLGMLKMKMEELVKAYNVYTDQKITINEVIPSELKSYFGIPAETEYFQTDHIGPDAGRIDQAEERT